jgi:hypothetical protein
MALKTALFSRIYANPGVSTIVFVNAVSAGFTYHLHFPIKHSLFSNIFEDLQRDAEARSLRRKLLEAHLLAQGSGTQLRQGVKEALGELREPDRDGGAGGWEGRRTVGGGPSGRQSPVFRGTTNDLQGSA